MDTANPLSTSRGAVAFFSQPQHSRCPSALVFFAKARRLKIRMQTILLRLRQIYLNIQ
jgi:hypothetical protein